MLRFVLTMILGGLCLGGVSFGQELDNEKIQRMVRSELRKKWADARIELLGPIRWSKEAPSLNSQPRVTTREIASRGEAEINAVDPISGRINLGIVSYAAWTWTLVPMKRIHPGERLLPEFFKKQEINGALGQAFEYRGLLMTDLSEVSQLEARQTILEGQPLLSTAVQKVPDVRRGDSVTIRLISGGLSISTRGVAEEPGYLSGKIRVMANRSKREFVGSLSSGGIVEVEL